MITETSGRIAAAGESLRGKATRQFTIEVIAGFIAASGSRVGPKLGACLLAHLRLLRFRPHCVTGSLYEIPDLLAAPPQIHPHRLQYQKGLDALFGTQTFL